MVNEMKIHRVIEGPFEDEEETVIWNLCLGEEGGELMTVEVFFDTFEEAYQFKNHFLTSIEPIVIHNEPQGEQ